MTETIKERTVRGFLGLGTYRLIGQSLTWAISILIARILRPEDYGLMALATVFLNLFGFISEFGLSSALVQKEQLEEKELNSSFWFTLAFNLAIYAVVASSAGPVARFYANPRLAAMIQVLGFGFIISALRIIPFCLLTRELEFTKPAKAEFFSSVASSVAMYLMALRGLGVWSLVLGSLTQSVVTTIMLFRYRPWRPTLRFNLGSIRPMLRFGMSVNLSKLLGYVSDNADNLIVGKLRGATALGLYNMAFILGTMPLKRGGAMIYQVAFPVFSRLQSDRELLARYFLRATRYIALIAFPAGIGLLLVADPFVRVVLRPKWLPMVIALKLLCAVGIVKALSITITPLLYATGRSGVMLRFSIVSALFLMAGFYAGARLSIEAVALAWCIVYPGLFAYLLWLVLRELDLPLRRYAATLGPAIAATAAMACAVGLYRLAAPPTPALQLAGAVGLGVLTYGGAVALLDRETIMDGVTLVRSAIKKKP